MKEPPSNDDDRKMGHGRVDPQPARAPRAASTTTLYPAPARTLAAEAPRSPSWQPSRGRPSAPAPSLEVTTTSVEAELMASLGQLKQRFRDVAAVVEGLGALRSLGGEEALIEMAMFAHSHEQTVEHVWRALADCERLARIACSVLSSSAPPPSDPAMHLSTDPVPPGVPSQALALPAEPDAAPPVDVPEDGEDDNPVTQVDVTPTRVLVVDDDPAVLRAFRRVLRGDYEIVTARDGAEALRVVLGGERVDAIICDIGMPKLDGPTFFSELFELRPQMMPRVVFCTGGLPNEKTQRFLDRLQAPLLFKPVAAPDLLRAIDFVRAR